MKKIAYTNTGPSLRFVGGQMVAPSETVYIDERDHPGYKPPAPAVLDAPPTDPVLELLDQSIEDITEQLAGLSDEDFERLQQAEHDGKTRKGLLKAFETESLRRAEQKVDGQKDEEPGE